MSESLDLDQLAWDEVRDALTVVATATREDRGTRPFAASAIHRLAVIHVQSAVRAEAKALTSGLPGANLSRLQRSLREQLAGRPPEYAVLEAIPAEVRMHARTLTEEALKLDAEFVPALLMEIALARVAQDFKASAQGLERILGIDQRPRVRARTFETLGDLHWHHLGSSESALGYLRAAVEADDPVPERLDKLLKLNLELENWDDAVACCDQLIELVAADPEKGPLAVTYRLTLGEIQLYGLESPGIALRHYLYAMRLMPDYDLTFTLLRELLAAHPWERLSTQYDEGEGSAPASPDLFTKLAEACALNPEPAQVVTALRLSSAT